MYSQFMMHGQKNIKLLNSCFCFFFNLFLVVTSQIFSSRYQDGKYIRTAFLFIGKKKDWVFQKGAMQIKF